MAALLEIMSDHQHKKVDVESLEKMASRYSRGRTADDFSACSRMRTSAAKKRRLQNQRQGAPT
ncbi:hypothetical protein [Paraburkholderia terrae]